MKPNSFGLNSYYRKPRKAKPSPLARVRSIFRRKA